jgi:DNA-binding Lrp family transcriptional regulator
MEGAMDLDGIDRAILRELRLDARQTNAALAAKISLSPSACHRRIRLLEAAGVIRGYTLAEGTADADRDRVSVIVQVTLERQTEDYLSAFEAAVRRFPEIRECFLMTGAADYWLRVEVESAAAYEALHGDALSRLPGVTRIHSSFAMRDALKPKSKRSFRA